MTRKPMIGPKSFLLFSAVALCAVGITLNSSITPEKRTASGPVSDVPPAESLELKTDQADIFRRAFWRRPDATDRILHAERREWTPNGAEGLSRWQWFLCVEPGPALKTWLREDNAFGVRPSSKVAVVDAPRWFPNDFSNYEIYQGGSSGTLVFLFSRNGNTVYAASSGKGFQPGGAGVTKRSTPVSKISVGRLPNESPPKR